ncbi:MAG: hypothetical protein Q7U55_09585, partial [Deltaproteobacteria bacterium]|nr:hypothetical protein [Deltaproteobacteria bacterium]
KAGRGALIKMRIILRIIGTFIIIAILFSYLPMDAMGNCSEEDPSTNTRMDCGYIFHCPLINDTAMPSLSILSINGRLRWMPTVGKVEELPRLIFHPPETLFKT